MPKTVAIILSAGKGSRMGLGYNKQFLNILDKPLIAYTLERFSECREIDEIILVCAENEIEYCKNNVVIKYALHKVSQIVQGGESRQQSVYNGLKAIYDKECDVVLIHDGARPFVDKEIIKNGITNAKVYGACACGVTPKDTIKVKNNNNISMGTIDRDSLFSIQTPQCFKYNTIMECHEKAKEDKIIATDDTHIVENYGFKVLLYEGSYDNIKITTKEDIFVAERIIKGTKGC